MADTKHLLLIRFSAMGDVAMLIPVVQNLLNQYPAVEVTIVSNAFLAPIFANIDRVHFHPANLKTTHKGFVGLWKLARELKKLRHFDAVADLHNVLRSVILRNFLKLAGIRNAVIDKGRAEKKMLTVKTGKNLHQLKTAHQRYASVLAELGFPVELTIQGSFLQKKPVPLSLQAILNPGKRWLGIAAFAQHAEKMYPVEKMKEVVQVLHQQANTQVIFIGGGEKENAFLKKWQDEFPGSLSIAGVISFEDQLALISNLQLIVSMDSANMHLGSMFNIPVVSIWGATHPFAGFLGWAQHYQNVVQTGLYCRPCSVFGNKPCYRGDHACMHLLLPENILERIAANE